ncbi:Penicillin amidase [Candidatus Sulfotelmatobacter sp. SbA7]|nr:Penicillin amidase [Candidatus Sulfotelmatobacter sp. SbA7]
MVSSVLIEPRSRIRISRVMAWVAGVLVLVALGIAGWLYSVALSALPRLDGKLQVPGIAASVTVLRDDHGIPTIDAANLDDLFFAQGYVTAQDRLFQMDGIRRYAAGELAEVVGSKVLEHDRQQRILGMRIAARKTIATISADDRARLEAYARGVNAFVESHRGRLPVEFRILGCSPGPWTSEDSALIGAYMVQELSTTPGQALVREQVLAKLGPELTADLYVNSSWRDRRPTATRPSLVQDTDDDDSDSDSSVAKLTGEHGPETSHHEILAELDQSETAQSWLREQVADFFDDRPLVLGSNNWVVSGTHTVSGKPLLSNDMHLGHQMPNLWYEAHLRCSSPACGNFDVAGVTLPGYPYVLVGHNQRVAWGFTNVGPTIEDVYIETFNDGGQYLTPEGWKSPERRHEVIHVNGQPDVGLDVAVTRHGPIVTELVPGETRKLALRWTLYDGARNPFFAVDSAQNWEQFVKGFSEFDAPGQNVVYADVDGNIGYHATGKIPIRASGDGGLPENGSDDAHEWTGYIPFDELPSIFNPPSGIIATANSRITPDKYPHSISAEWEAPWRSARIYRVLESGKKFSAADMLALQTDIYSDLDRIMAEKFVYAVDHAQKPSVRAKAAAEILRQWDGRMTADSAAPTIAVRGREQLARLLLEPKLGPAPANPEQIESTLSWKSYDWLMETVWLETVAQHQPKRWLPNSYPNYEELLTAAIESAVTASDVPADLNAWKWGGFNPVEIQHPILGRIPLLRHWTGPGLREQSGSGFTVKAVSRTHGPSERMTVDLADLDRSTLNLVTGEAGNFLSPYYMDQWQAWYENSTLTWPFSPPAVQKASVHRLVLEGAK